MGRGDDAMRPGDEHEQSHTMSDVMNTTEVDNNLPAEIEITE